MFEKYIHLEKLGNTEVNGITEGLCYIFPKLDGTNGSVFIVDDNLCAGSRNRQLSLTHDNAGFYAHVLGDTRYHSLLKHHPNWIIYGEFLVPHMIKTYVEDAWRKFYVFDVYDATETRYLSYEEYKDILEIYRIEYLKPIDVIANPPESDLLKLLLSNNFLIQEGKGIGEGIVIKNYSFQNKYGRYTSAKMISDDFKERKTKQLMDKSIDPYYTEQQIVDAFCTEHLIKKTYHKILTEANNEWSSKKHIPQLIGTIWYDFINEEMWNTLKKFKNVTINFKALNSKVIIKTKETLTEVF